MLFTSLLLALQFLATVAAYQIHTGFNYGAFWGSPASPKRSWEYEEMFKAAYALNTSVAFDSARLFTCRQPGTTDQPIEALGAAVKTHTYILLGFYLAEVKESARKPGHSYETNPQMLHYELRALENAFKAHGQKLANLLIGLSVGNEDLEEWYAQRETGVDETVIKSNIGIVREAIRGGRVFDQKFPNISKYMKDKLIGHTDTAPYAAKVLDVDFIGINAYPYWSRDPPSVAKQSYFSSLEATKKTSRGKEIWLTEVGWPFKDTRSLVVSQGTASAESLQKYWNDIGCAVFGKYTTFWFELRLDTVLGQPDWAILGDGNIPRIDLSCGIGRKAWEPSRRDLPSSVAPAVTEPSTASRNVSSPPGFSPSAPIVQKIYTGFSYGAFWSENEPKFYKDFLRQFTLAKNLPNVPVPFSSARLYQIAQWGAPQEPSEAFQAAIETNTTLLLGLWLPIDNELIALDKAFEKHGQKLVDLVIGISIGNEDIYRGSDECTQKENKPCQMAATADEVVANITYVKSIIQQKPWYKLFKSPPPIGHADIARNAALKEADFVGTNIFPFWHPDPIDKAWESFEISLTGIKKRAGNVPVWITETGWPSAGTNDTTASLDNMQKYWSTVGCSLFGKYTTFWFELEKDTHDPGNLDWGLIDIPSQEPKIKDLSCPSQPGPSTLPSPSGHPGPSPSTSNPAWTIQSTIFSATAEPSSSPSESVSKCKPAISPPSFGNTTHITLTSIITVQPSAGNGVPLSSKNIVTVTSYVTIKATGASQSPKLQTGHSSPLPQTRLSAADV
ncbi:hypothetical protein N0V90_006081 [Kalmusia sp. IMI 367209]|nr:hypothetical protein N0V90_006081 [Kalmusia sp. IMI 367209]